MNFLEVTGGGGGGGIDMITFKKEEKNEFYIFLVTLCIWNLSVAHPVDSLNLELWYAN